MSFHLSCMTEELVHAYCGDKLPKARKKKSASIFEGVGGSGGAGGGEWC